MFFGDMMFNVVPVIVGIGFVVVFVLVLSRLLQRSIVRGNHSPNDCGTEM